MYRMYVPKLAERREKAIQRARVKIEAAERKIAIAEREMARAKSEQAELQSTKLENRAELDRSNQRLAEVETILSARATQAWGEAASIRAWSINSALAGNVAGLWALMQLASDAITLSGRSNAMMTFMLGIVASFLRGLDHRKQAVDRAERWERQISKIGMIKIGKDVDQADWPIEPDKKPKGWLGKSMEFVNESLFRFVPLGCFIVGTFFTIMDYQVTQKAKAESRRVAEQKQRNKDTLNANVIRSPEKQLSTKTSRNEPDDHAPPLAKKSAAEVVRKDRPIAASVEK